MQALTDAANGNIVAPHAGAWIEIGPCSATRSWNPVAPHAGAWIEICSSCDHPHQLPSLPMRERGLKFVLILYSTMNNVVAPHAGAWIEISRPTIRWTCRPSLPMRERGLKSAMSAAWTGRVWSLPMRERGLKSDRDHAVLGRIGSLPMRERGLKSCGPMLPPEITRVAPHAGAWIEI